MKSAIAGDIWRQNTFETLVDHNAVELGYELKCTKCGSWSWHELRKLGPQITCHLCLKSFDFPVKNPGGSQQGRWAYRVIGPFALPDYAGGGYAAALSIRFFGQVVGGISGPTITWAAGQNLTFRGGQSSEVDFALWYQRKEIARCDFPTEILFGEAKSFGKDAFEDRDVARMRGLAERYPGAIFVFATMRNGEDLTADEITRIRRFAEWGRKHDRSRRRTRAPVIVLTGTELFAAHSLEQAWKDKGGRHAQLIEPAWIRTENLTTIADLSQQLYLGMPSYSVWHQQELAKRRKRV